LLKQETQGPRSEARRWSTPTRQLADWRSGAYPYKNLLSRRVYESQKYLLQVELLKLQAWAKETGQRVVILFEGRDAAGKGGTIKRFMEHLNPRGARVVALEKPSEVERGQWYFQRYVQHLPTAGEIVLFDRSWYNRAGVERVMGFCSDDEYQEFMRQAPQFERHLVRSGVHLIKFWFSVSREEQRRRFKERKVHPLKQWKLSPIDLASLDKWDDYTKAKEAMFFDTDTPRHRGRHQERLQEARAPERHALRAAEAALHQQGQQPTSARWTHSSWAAPTWSTSAASARAARSSDATKQALGFSALGAEDHARRPARQWPRNHRNDQLAIVRPRKGPVDFRAVAAAFEDHGNGRLSGNDSIMPKKSRPQLSTSGGYHCSQLWRAATKAPNTAATHEPTARCARLTLGQHRTQCRHQATRISA
jgi:polyphosphate kinase 2